MHKYELFSKTEVSILRIYEIGKYSENVLIKSGSISEGMKQPETNANNTELINKNIMHAFLFVKISYTSTVRAEITIADIMIGNKIFNINKGFKNIRPIGIKTTINIRYCNNTVQYLIKTCFDIPTFSCISLYVK